MSIKVIRAFQFQNNLSVDGVAGPNTNAMADRVLLPYDKMPEVPDYCPVVRDESVGTDYERMVWSWANWFANAGAREIGGNNSGPWVAFFHKIPDDGDPDNDGSWCASFQATCFERAARQVNITAPMTYSRRQRGGAKALFGCVARAGGRVKVEDLEPYQIYVICWDRGTYAWQGHIELGYYDPVRDDFVTIGGNVGSFKRVAGRVRKFRHESWQHKLHGIARLGA